MRTSFVVRLVLLAAISSVPLSGAWGAQTLSYDQLISKAQAHLNGGQADYAVRESEAAITLAPQRWQAYVLAGGALQVEGNYDQAIGDFTQALKLAPASKQTAVKNLLEKCMRAQIAATSTPLSQPPSSPAPLDPPGGSPDQGPSYHDTVEWIMAHMAEAGIPQNDNTSANEFASFKQSQLYSITVQSCDSFTIRWHLSTVETPTGAGASGSFDAGGFDAVFQFDIRHVSFASANSPEGVEVLALDGVGNWHFHSDSGADDTSPIDWSSELSFDALKGRWKDFKSGGGSAYAWEGGTVVPGITIPLGEKPGTENMAPHMLKAFQHLIDICKSHPEEAPHSLF